MKKRWMIGGVICLAIALIAVGTLAYLTVVDRATNVITTGTVDLTLHEMAYDGAGALVEYPSDTITGVMPGQEISKIPYVENTGTQPFYTRVKVSVTITAKDEKTELDTAVVELDIDTTNWILGTDGWYYYSGQVAPESETPALFETVTFNKGMSNAYQGCTVEIDVVAQGVQVKNNPIPDGGSVLDITGWPADPAVQP